MELNQVVLYLERLPDENQTDHIDWGFRISVLYGLDYRFTTISRGLFSDQLLKHNSYYGFDMPMVYLDLYIPYVFQGMNIRIGRIISEPDIEAQLAPNNLMASHSLLYGFDNYAQERNFHDHENQRSVDDSSWYLGRYRCRSLAKRSGSASNRHGNGPMDLALTRWIRFTRATITSTTGSSATTICNRSLERGHTSSTTRFIPRRKPGTCIWNDAIDHPTKEVPFQSGSFPVQNWLCAGVGCAELHDVPDCPECVLHGAKRIL